MRTDVHIWFAKEHFHINYDKLLHMIQHNHSGQSRSAQHVQSNRRLPTECINYDRDINNEY